MRSRISSRLIAPLIACGIAGGAAVVGGACLPTASSDHPSLQNGRYVLTTPNFHGLPGTITDSTGRILRVLADTFVINASQYEERASVAITPAGGTEQPPVPFIVSRRPLTIDGPTSFVVPVTLYGGMIKGTVLDNTAMQLAMPDRTFWRYDYR
jgi:hypothetical protein